MSDQDLVRLHAIVEGRVQGVGFRFFAQERAVLLGLTGWVRNRWEGTVEVVAEGPREKVEKLLQSLERGPHAGTTRYVAVDWQAAAGEFATFRVRETV